MKRKVLFLCTGNSCRSQMAEAIVNARLTDQWDALTDDIADFRKVRDDIETEITKLLEQVG